MKLTIEGTSEEIKNVLQAISDSEEHFDAEKFYNQVMKLENRCKLI